MNTVRRVASLRGNPSIFVRDITRVGAYQGQAAAQRSSVQPPPALLGRSARVLAGKKRTLPLPPLTLTTPNPNPNRPYPYPYPYPYP